MFTGVRQECTPFPTLFNFFDLITSKVPTLFRSMEKIGYVDDVAHPPVMQRFSTDPQEVRNFNRPDPSGPTTANRAQPWSWNIGTHHSSMFYTTQFVSFSFRGSTLVNDCPVYWYLVSLWFDLFLRQYWKITFCSFVGWNLFFWCSNSPLLAPKDGQFISEFHEWSQTD